MKRASLVALVALAAARDARGDATVAESTEQLANGLRLIVAPDPTASAVAVYVSYRFGTGDDDRGGGLYAHVLERVLAGGGPRARARHVDLTLDAIGGWSSSSTTADRVATVDVVPPGALAYALWLEADRMSVGPAGITNDEVERELAAIQTERSAAYDQTPVALVERAIADELWRGGEYEANRRNALAPLGDRRADFARPLALKVIEPSNATIVIAGAVTSADVRRLVARYFAGLPSADAFVRAPAPPVVPLRGGIPVATARDATTRVVLAARAPRDTAELWIAAQLLAAGKRGRLVAAMVDPGLALEVHARIEPRAIGSELVVEAVVKPGADPDAVRAAIVAELVAIGTEPSDPGELEVAKAGAEADRIRALESLAFRASALATWAEPTNPWHSRIAERDALRAVTPESLRAAGAMWLNANAIVSVIGHPP